MIEETGETMAFWIDRDYDNDRASDGESRYGVYIREAIGRDSYAWDLADGQDDDGYGRIEFAATAWRAATPPVMAPGYVRYHHLITGTSVNRSQWDGSLTGAVTLATPPPAPIAKLHRWRGWVDELEGDHYRPVGPYEQQVAELTKSDFYTGFALTTVELVFPLPAAAAALPALPPGPDSPGLAHTAAVAVGVLVGALNDLVVPLLDALEGKGAR